MKTSAQPSPFAPHPGLSDEINRAIVKSEIEGGVFLDSLPEGALIEVETQHHRYRILNCRARQVLISGHPRYCPRPLRAVVRGSTWGGSMIKLGFIGRGMRLEFEASNGRVISTSRIKEIRQLPD